MAGLLNSNPECRDHIHAVTLRWKRGGGLETRLASILFEPLDAKTASGLLRALGENIDGFCVTDNATNEGFLSASGMQFHFRTLEKAQEFKSSLSKYLNPQLLAEIDVR